MRQIKKYPNRRLYDTATSSYVNLDFLKQCLIAGENIEVIDVKTKEDITHTLLLQIINVQEGTRYGQRLMTNQVLMQLIRFYESPLSVPMSQMLEQTFSYLELQQKRHQQWLDATKASSTSANPFAHNMKLWTQWMGNQFANSPFVPPTAPSNEKS